MNSINIKTTNVSFLTICTNFDMIIKRLLCLLLISSWSILSESSVRMIGRSRRAYFRNKSCFCFQKPHNFIDVPQLIDTKGNGLERLVVYFYRDIKTKELKIYTPNIEKQRLVPNLAFEDGDYLDTTISQEVIDLFNVNPNVIDSSAVFDNDFDISISKEPLGYNIGAIEKTDSIYNVMPPNYDYNIQTDEADLNTGATKSSNIIDSNLSESPNSQNPISNSTPTEVAVPSSETIIFSPNDENANYDPNVQPLLLNSKYLEYVPQFHSPQIINTGSADQNQLFKHHITSHLISDNSQSNHLPFNYGQLDLNTISPKYHGPDSVGSDHPKTDSPVNSVPSSGYPKLDDFSTGNSNVDYQGYAEINNNYGSPIPLPESKYSGISHHDSDHLVEDIKFDSVPPETVNNIADHPEYGNTEPVNPETGKNNHNKLNHETNDFNSGYSDFDKPSPIDHYLDWPNQKSQLTYPMDNKIASFEKWFQNQIEGLHNSKGNSYDDDLDDNSIRALVQDVLRQNNIIVTNDGMVTKDGVRLNTNDLTLRPIMIGDSVGYDKLLQSEDKLGIPSLSEFSKAVLVSLVNPFKVLGVIPHGKTNVPNKNWQLYAASEAVAPFKQQQDPYNINAPSRSVAQSNNALLHFHPNSNSVQYGQHAPQYNPTFTHICKLKKCNSKALKDGRKTVRQRPRIEHEYAPHRIGYKGRKGITGKRFKSDSHLLGKNQHGSLKNSDKIVVKTRRFPIVNLMSRVWSLFNPETSDTRKTKSRENSRLSENYYDEEEEFEDDKDSMFRIIGGTAATGTGAPLNVRGRRGTNF